jgi:hypothetical protein
MPAVHKLPPDLLGQVLIRVQYTDTKILSLVHKPWHQVVSLDSNPRVWGRLHMASRGPGVLVWTICNDKVCIMFPFSALFTTLVMCLL